MNEHIIKQQAGPQQQGMVLVGSHDLPPGSSANGHVNMHSMHTMTYDDMMAIHHQGVMHHQHHMGHEQQGGSHEDEVQVVEASVSMNEMQRQQQETAVAMSSLGLSANLVSLLGSNDVQLNQFLDPNDPNHQQTVQNLIQLQQQLASGQPPISGASSDALGPLSHLVNVAMQLAGEPGGGQALQANVNSLLAGLDPNSESDQNTAAAFGVLGETMQSMGGMQLQGGDPHGMQHGHMQPGSSGQRHYRAGVSSGRSRKMGDSHGHSGPPGGNWMRRYHEYCYLGDKSALDSAKMSSSTLTLNVQWVDMPEQLHSRVPISPAPIDVPINATVGYLKRAICRALGGNLWPSVLRYSWTKEELLEYPEDRLLSSYQIENSGSLILMEANYLPIPEVPNLALVQNRHQHSSMLTAPSPAGTKERFTLSEMYALVDGMEIHGLKWAKIHKDNKELENKTQGDLKDKWRNWQRNVANNWATARVYMPDDLKQRIEKLVASLPQQHTSIGGRHLRGVHMNHNVLAITGSEGSLNHVDGMGLDAHQLALMQQQQQQQQQVQQQQQYEAAVAAMQSGMSIPGMADATGLDPAQLAAISNDPAMAQAMVEAMAQQHHHHHHLHQQQGVVLEHAVQHHYYDPSQM